MPRSGSRTAAGGWPTPARPTACASSRPGRCSAAPRRRRRWARRRCGSRNGLRIVLSARAEGPASEYPWLALAAGAGRRLDGHADRHRERHAAHAAHRDPGGAGRARPGDADDPDPAGGARRERVPPDALARRRRAHPAADAGAAAGERRPLAPPDAGRRPRPRRRLRASPRHRRARSGGRLRRRRPRRQRRDDRRRAACRRRAGALAAGAEAGARRRLAGGRCPACSSWRARPQGA